MNTAPVFALLGLVTLCAACGDRPAAQAPPEGKVNADSSLGPPVSQRPAERADAEDPQTGTNSGRPDSPKDLAPGTDGNTNPPAQ